MSDRSPDAISIRDDIPVTIIGGYLGAGKTTLVNHWLRHANGRRIAVLVNDFGDINIDADLIESQSGDVISLAGGCVCCSFGSDLVGRLVELVANKPSIDQVLIETSGVALPAPVANIVKLAQGLRHDATIVVCDAEQVRERAGDKYVGDTVMAQLRAADLLLLNKTDLIGDDSLAQLRHWLGGVSRDARLLSCVRAEVDARYLLPIVDARSIAEAAPITEAALNTPAAATTEDRPAPAIGRSANLTGLSPLGALNHNAAAQFASVSFEFEHWVDASRLAQALATAAFGLYRSKALVRDREGDDVIVQTVANRWEVIAARRPHPSPGRLICIGAPGVIDPDAIRALLDAARAG